MSAREWTRGGVGAWWLAVAGLLIQDVGLASLGVGVLLVCALAAAWVGRK